MNELMKKLVPAAMMAMFVSVAFAGTPHVPSTSGVGSASTVAQADPTPEFCKKNPTDPRCKDKDK